MVLSTQFGLQALGKAISMATISAVIITKNEEKNIERCLQSLDGIVDEIIVLDSFSTDKTEHICKAYNVHFVKRLFTDYSDAKNYANSLTTHPFILSIDADEELSENLRESITAIKSDLKDDGYYCHRKTNYCGHWINHCGWYPDTKLRLWRKTKGAWQGKIHETLELSNGSTKLLQGDLLHYSYPSMESHAKQIHTFAEMAARDLFEKRKKVSVVRLIVGPVFEFHKKFFLQKGFLDGYYGFVISVMSAYYNFYKYAKLKDLWIANNAPPNKK